LDKYAILSTSQYGIKKIINRYAVYALLNEVLIALNNKVKVKGIFCDIEKASDCINHEVHLQKLEVCGVTGITKK
jgi:hypothetical protein